MPVVEFLPDLGAVAAAAFLVLIAAALWVLSELIRQSLGRVPVVGPWIAVHIAGALNDARLAVLRAAVASWDAAVRLFHWLQSWIFRQLVSLLVFASDTVSTVWHIATVQVPQAETRIEATALGWIDSAAAAVRAAVGTDIAAVRSDLAAADRAITSAYDASVAEAKALFGTAKADIRAGITAAEAYAAAEVVQLDRELSAELAGLSAAVAADLAGAQQLAAGLFSTAEADLTRGLSAAEALAFSQVQALQRGIYTDLENWGDQAVTQAWPDVAGDLQALRGALGADFPWLNDLIDALGGLGAAGLAGALIQSLAGAHAITRLAADCIVPNCRNLSGLGNDLAGLAALFSAGVIFAWIAEGVADPSAWARDTSAVLGPVGSRTVARARATFGA